MPNRYGYGSTVNKVRITNSKLEYWKLFITRGNQVVKGSAARPWGAVNRYGRPNQSMEQGWGSNRGKWVTNKGNKAGESGSPIGTGYVQSLRGMGKG